MPERKVNIKDFTISQSKMRDYYKIPSPFRGGGSGKFNDPMCGIAWWYQYIEGIRNPPSLVMKKGLYFEHHLIGAARGGQEPPRVTNSEIRRTKDGGYRVGNGKAYPTEDEAWANYIAPEEVELDELLIEARRIFKSLKIRKIDVQPEWIDKKPLPIESHVDLIAKYKGKECIVDIKYTETKHDDRWNGGWGAPEYLDQDKLIQPIHYVLHDWIRSGMPVDEEGREILKPFYYLIFGRMGAKGERDLWSKMIEVEVTSEAIGKHIDDMQRMVEELHTWTPEPINDYIKCKKCFYNTRCSKVTKVPQVEKIIV